MSQSQPEQRLPPFEGLIRPARRPEGWQAPGPLPPPLFSWQPSHLQRLLPQSGEDLCYLTGDWRILQQQQGHRWSVDDLVTAWQACEGLPAGSVRRSLDLGCGIGSVLMMVAWNFPQAQAVGVEAQAISVGLARRSLILNGIEARVMVRWGDLRDESQLPEGRVFDLVTGTPPYFRLGQGVTSAKVQCGPCRFEYRGGVEAYCDAAARALAPSGRFVVCEDADQEPRVLEALRAVGLHLRTVRQVIPKQGKPPLFTVFTAGWPTDDVPEPLRCQLTVRDPRGQWTDEFRALRQAMGMPCLDREKPSAEPDSPTEPIADHS